MEQPTLIFDIKRYAINDGPGIRITVFFKGCPLKCKWCHNPESIPSYQEKMYANEKCIGSIECVKNCPNNALTLTPNGIVTNTELCKMCGICADICPTKAIEMMGKQMTVEQVMSEIKKETILMDQSEGGVTFSGGEPLLHYNFLIELLDACGKEDIHRCIDTSAFSSQDRLLEVAKKSEHFLFDLKLMNSKKHEEWTGVPNENILENIKTIAATGIDYNIRIPLISGVNDDLENIHESAKFITSLVGKKPIVNILPFHNIAERKYQKLGRAYEKGIMKEPSIEKQNELISIFKSYDINVMIGG